MVREQTHAGIIQGFSDIYRLCGELRNVISQTRGRMQGTGFAIEGLDGAPGLYAEVAALENAATVLMREYVGWASPLDVGDEFD